ncbi:hypothetical protein VKT23_002152 [Stygiomarasmius scandens]|uniref:Uncharacterized protein n=1 Tax=Marasmiellus scandens TaxID=2682957 RepID=A0ABR1K774_9AGAR
MTSTFEINALPKVDKNQFITSFIQSQKPHAKAYAEEGLSAFANDSPNKENQFGFSSTPLLKARNPKHDVQETAESQPSVKFKTSEGRKQLSSVRTKTFVKKRSTNEGSDNEDQVARLAERRERKRAKRMVVKAAATVEPSVCSETVKNGRSKNQKKEKESGRTTAKVPPALALMHGFSATNVGNKRLTAPPPVIGVFSKGKASNKTLVSNKKASTRNVMQSFSEEIFLNKTFNKTSDPKRFKAETHDDSASENALELSKSKIHVSDNGPQVDSSSTIESLREDPHTDTLPPQISNKDADGSNIWDIERDSFVLPSSAPDLPPSPRLERQSIVLDIRDLPWSTSVPMQAHENNSPFCSDPLSSIPSNAQRCTKSSSSLAPSQSASQCGFAHRRTVDKPVVITSKYFTQKAGEIVCDTDRSLSPPIKDPRKDPPSLICPYDIQQELEEEEPLVTDTFREANICPLDHCLGSDEDQAQAVPMLSERERRDAFRDQEGRTFPGTFLETEDVPNNLTDACQYQEDPVYTTALDGHQDENYTIPASSFLPYAPSSEINYSFEQSWHVLPLWSVEHPPEEPFLASDAEGESSRCHPH